MNNIGLKVALGVVSLVAVVFAVLYFAAPPLGANAGPDFYNRQYFRGGLDARGFGSLKGVLDLSNTTSATPTAAQVCDYSVINHPAIDLTTTSTLPTAATLQDAGSGCLTEPGQYKDVLYRNTGTATTTIRFTAGASSTIQYEATSTEQTIIGGNAALLRFYSLTETAGTNMVEVQLVDQFR